MGTTKGLYELEQLCETLVVTPTTDLQELRYEEIESGARDVLGHLDTGPVKNVVLDFQRTAYYGSTALGFFIKVWKRVRSRGGQMAFCNVSGLEREILQVTKLDGLWPVCASRAEALAAVGR
jgi:anti-anti-sigma factor